jgi:molybdopterin-guanine dinucleotide biosynthesis protein A
MITGAVLSGGGSTRFGEDKGLVTLSGIPMVAHVVRAVRRVADEVLVAVAPGMTSRYSEVLDDDVLVFEDETAGDGPIRGLITSLEGARGDYVLLSPCDAPLLRSDVCRLVTERAKGRDGASPMIGGYLEPLHACYRRDICLKAFKDALASGMRKPKDAYGGLDLLVIDEEEIRAVDANLDSFLNVNTQREHDVAVERHERGS